MKTLLRIGAAAPILLLAATAYFQITWQGAPPMSGKPDPCTAWSSLPVWGELVYLGAIIALAATIAYSFTGAIVPWWLSVAGVILTHWALLLEYGMDPVCVSPNGQILVPIWKFSVFGLYFFHMCCRAFFTAQKSLAPEP